VQEAKHEFLVMSDSDVRVEADYLKQVAAPFARPEVGAVTTLYKSMTDGSLAADLNALGMALESAPSTLVARRLEGRMQFAFGWTMATTKSILAKIGGWESMANHHSDDFELGNRIARLGYRVELMRKPVWMVMSRETLRQYFAHELRWAIGLKNVRPSGYWGLICTQGLAWTGVAAGLAAGTNRLGLAAAYVLAYLILRLGLAWTAGVWGLGDRAITKKLWLVPLRDAIGFCVWIAGFFSDEIVWRGLEYRVRDKKLLPVRAMHHSTPGLHARREIAQLEKILP
jgi:ceramide glucosyltransferase